MRQIRDRIDPRRGQKGRPKTQCRTLCNAHRVDQSSKRAAVEKSAVLFLFDLLVGTRTVWKANRHTQCAVWFLLKLCLCVCVYDRFNGQLKAKNCNSNETQSAAMSIVYVMRGMPCSGLTELRQRPKRNFTHCKPRDYGNKNHDSHKSPLFRTFLCFFGNLQVASSFNILP